MRGIRQAARRPRRRCGSCSATALDRRCRNARRRRFPRRAETEAAAEAGQAPVGRVAPIRAAEILFTHRGCAPGDGEPSSCAANEQPHDRRMTRSATKRNARECQEQIGHCTPGFAKRNRRGSSPRLFCRFPAAKPAVVSSRLDHLITLLLMQGCVSNRKCGAGGTRTPTPVARYRLDTPARLPVSPQPLRVPQLSCESSGNQSTRPMSHCAQAACQ